MSVEQEVYVTHDNGTRPFTCKVDREAQTVRVINNRDPLGEEMFFRYNRLFLGKDPDHLENLGNSILLHKKDNRYLYIGESIIELVIEEDEVVDYFSPISCNDSPYPYALGKKNFYLFPWDVEGAPIGLMEFMQVFSKPRLYNLNSPYIIKWEVDGFLNGIRHMQEELKKKAEHQDYDPRVDDEMFDRRELIDKNSEEYKKMVELKDSFFAISHEIIVERQHLANRFKRKKIKADESDPEALLIEEAKHAKDHDEFVKLFQGFRGQLSKTQMLSVLYATENEKVFQALCDEIGDECLIAPLDVKSAMGDYFITYDNVLDYLKTWDWRFSHCMWLLKRKPFREYCNDFMDRGGCHSFHQHPLVKIISSISYSNIQPQELAGVMKGLRLKHEAGYSILHYMIAFKISDQDLIKACLENGIGMNEPFLTPKYTVDDEDMEFSARLSPLQYACNWNNSVFIYNLFSVVAKMYPNENPYDLLHAGRDGLIYAIERSTFQVVRVLLNLAPKADFDVYRGIKSSHGDPRADATTRKIISEAQNKWTNHLIALHMMIRDQYLRLNRLTLTPQVTFFKITSRLNMDTLIRICKLVYDDRSYHSPSLSISKISQALKYFFLLNEFKKE